MSVKYDDTIATGHCPSCVGHLHANICVRGERCHRRVKESKTPKRKKKRSPSLVAADLREMAGSLWDVEYRLHVDEDAELLLEAAALLDERSAVSIGKTRRTTRPQGQRS